MPYVPTMRHIDDVFADILGMITNALQRTHHPHNIQRAPNRARILHHERYALAMDGFVFFIDNAILFRCLERLVSVESGEGIKGVVYQLLNGTPQVFHFALVIGRALLIRQACRNSTHLFAFIADALEIGAGLDDGHDQTQVASSR